MQAPWETIVGDLHGALAPAGLDLAGATTVGAYDGLLEGEARARLGLGGDQAPDRLLVCVGNTRALWPALLHAMTEDPALLDSADPVDDHAERALARAAEAIAARHGVACRAFAVREAGPPRLAIARLGVAAGLGDVAPCHLLVHPLHGPWIGLRGALVVDVPGPARSSQPDSPCARCAERPCVGAYEAAVRASGGVANVTRESLARAMHAWVAVRVACPVGAPSRYDDAQTEYHYTKNRALLPGRGARDAR